MKKHFIKFLKEEDVYEAYRYNFITYGNNSLKDVIFHNKDLLNTSSIYYENLIMSAFTWAFTKEGVDFWSEIHKKWRKIVRKLKNKGVC